MQKKIRKAALDSLQCAHQHVQEVGESLAGESSAEQLTTASGRLLDAAFQVRSKVENLVLAWLGKPNEILKALGESGNELSSELLELDQQISQWFSEHSDQSLTCLMVDCDLLGGLNEQHGSLLTDQAWDELYDRVMKELVASDKLVAECQLAGRRKVIWCAIAGNEAEELAEQIRQAIDDSKVPYQDNTLRLTASLALAPVDSSDTVSTTHERVLACRDAAKNGGRNMSYAWDGSEPAIVLPAGVDVPRWSVELSALANTSA